MSLGDRIDSKLRSCRVSPGQSVGGFLDEAIDMILREDRGPKAQLRDKALEEKDKQQGSDDDDIFGAAPEGGGGDEGGQRPQPDDVPVEEPKQDTAEIGRQMGGPQKKQASDDVEALRAVPDMGDVVDKLNAVRSGRSFKDDDVRSAFEEYYSGLDEEEKVALFAFLKGIAQVTSGEVPGSQAVEPEDKPADIQMKKGTEPDDRSRSLKPNVIKKVEPPKSKHAQPGAEDTTAPMPVQPKRRG